MPAEERIAKVIARAGVASRRDAEAMIAAGRVTLNGAPVTSPALNVERDAEITVDGEPLPARERTRLWLFHKPRGLVTTFRDPEGRATVFESLPDELPRVVAIGRLDINTEGLLLLTNDGGLARVLAHPETGWLRRYRVRAQGEITQERLNALRAGITIDGMDYGSVEATLDRIQGDNAWMTLGLREGKNREIKRILEHLGLRVNRLIRLSFGPFQLGEIEPGLVEEIRTRILKDQLGTTLSEEAGVDFDGPVREPIAPFGRSIPSAGDTKPPRASESRPPRAGARPPRPRSAAPRERGDDRPRRGDSYEPVRSRDGDARSGRGERSGASSNPSRARSEHPHAARAAGQPRSVWRAGEEDGPRGDRPVKPRRDPKAEREAGAARPRERVGAIRSGEGRKILVERLVETRTDDRRDGSRGRSQGRSIEARPGRDTRDRDARASAGPARPRGKPGGFKARFSKASPSKAGPSKAGPHAGKPRGDRPGKPGPRHSR